MELVLASLAARFYVRCHLPGGRAGRFEDTQLPGDLAVALAAALLLQDALEEEAQIFRLYLEFLVVSGPKQFAVTDYIGPSPRGLVNV